LRVFAFNLKKIKEKKEKKKKRAWTALVLWGMQVGLPYSVRFPDAVFFPFQSLFRTWQIHLQGLSVKRLAVVALAFRPKFLLYETASQTDIFTRLILKFHLF